MVKINNVDVYNLLHKEAQDVIVRAGSSFDMVIQRYDFFIISIFCHFIIADRSSSLAVNILHTST